MPNRAQRTSELGSLGRFMSRWSFIILASALAVVLTVLGWQQVMIYKTPSATRLALWFPFIVLFGAREAVLVSFIQFPALAIAFVFAARRWPAGRVFVALGVLYTLCAGAALIIMRPR